MWRRVLVAGISSMIFFPAVAQLTKQFSVSDRSEIKLTDFSLKVNGGYYLLKSGAASNELINIYTNENLDTYAHKYVKEINGQICDVSLALKESGEASLSQKISYKMFGNEESKPDKIWKVYLASGKPYRLNLNYGVGTANIDLSGLAVENLKVYSGNADVKIDYDPTTCNTVEMDTFLVQVDLGSVVVKHLNLSKSKYVQAEVGFGNVYLDFSDKPTIASNVKGSVGAGNLMITLPDMDVPVRVKVNDSWLCKVKLPENFEKIDDHTYVNYTQAGDIKNLLTFDLDVSMGNIIFKHHN